MKRIYRRALVAACVAACACGGVIVLAQAHEKAPVALEEGISYPVRDVIDGDTFKVGVDGIWGTRLGERTVTVRLLGIDTPETVDPRKPAQCFGAEASAETKRLLADAEVRLEFSTGRELKDKYGRYLAYAYRASDGLLVNEYLLERGFAREYTVGKAHARRVEFVEAEGRARHARAGLWGSCAGSKAHL